MFGNDEQVEIFRATMSIFGAPVSVLSPGRIGTQVTHVEPTVFYFYAVSDGYLVSAGDISGKQYVALDGDGYLGIGNRAERFSILDLENNFLAKKNLPQGEVVINLYSSRNERVIQFDGDDAFDDQETLYNFLIAGRKVRRENLSGEVTYMVPDGRGAWVRCSGDKSFTPKPVPIVLNIQ
ncbi:hypothetical protein [Pseudomonas sp. GL-RE-26]|uniref:hypothetical protein n=1 Tax=Pseudomonas sp. GL-RE-26 TaxID=2832390 RepID=UPI001CC06E8D|nr:hypothetical protein [Pseudomonas sp. GL-RE-26]